MAVDQPTAVKEDLYGWGSFTPSCLQRLHNQKFLVVCLGTAIFGVRAGMSLFPALATTIMQRFNLNTVHIGFIQSFSDVVGIIFTPIVSHYGEKGHKGRWLAWSYVFVATATSLFTLPQWLSDTYTPMIANVSLQTDTCARGKLLIVEANKCADITSTWASQPFWIFVLASALGTVGSIPSFTLGGTYIDENVMQSSSPLYLATLFAAGLLGQGVGIALSGVTLTVPGDFYRMKSSAASASGQPLFYGAWWIGYLVATVVILSCVIPLFGFSKDLPAKSKYRKRDVQQQHQNKTDAPEIESKTWSSYPKILKALVTNPVYICNALQSALQIFLISGLLTFLPLYFEQILQFHRSTAAFGAGLLVLVPTLAGSYLSAAIIRRRKWTIRNMLYWLLALCVISCGSGLVFLISCPTAHMAGVDVDYNGVSNRSASIDQPCNEGCNCKAAEFSPVCYDELRMEFYSACYAGCSSHKDASTSSECECISAHFPGHKSVKRGFCDQTVQCTRRKLATATAFAVVFFIGGMQIQPMLQLSLRSVQFELRTVATGVKSVLAKLLGFIPGPFLFGIWLNASCEKHVTNCGQPGPCAKYDHEGVTTVLLTVCTVISVLATLLTLMPLLLYRPRGDLSLMDKLMAKFSRSRVSP